MNRDEAAAPKRYEEVHVYTVTGIFIASHDMRSQQIDSFNRATCRELVLDFCCVCKEFLL